MSLGGAHSDLSELPVAVGVPRWEVRGVVSQRGSLRWQVSCRWCLRVGELHALPLAPYLWGVLCP